MTSYGKIEWDSPVEYQDSKLLSAYQAASLFDT